MAWNAIATMGKAMKTAYAEIAPFVTKDGSTIRELFHPTAHGRGNMSFAEAIVAPGKSTLLHLHRESEEIYYVTEGTGTMRRGDDAFSISAGDTIVIPPGTRHNVSNTCDTELKILCMCYPPYADDDTEML